MEKRERFYLILFAALILVIVFLGWRIGSIKNSNQEALDELKKSIIMNDSLTKEADGRYAKLVNYYATENNLKNELKESNKELYKIIRKQDERILSLTNAVITLKGELAEGFGSINKADTNLIDLALKYPKEGDPFINWNGYVNRKTAYYKGDWSFGKLPLQIVLTEEKRGLWKSRLIGPDWLVVDSMSINSLPAEEYSPVTERKIQFLAGGGFIKSLSPNGTDAINVGFGLSLFSNHNIILNATSNKEIGLNYYYRFQSFKRKK